MNEQIFVVSWTGNNRTENYYEIFKDIDNARLLVRALKNAREFVDKEHSAPTYGTLRMLGNNFYYNFRRLDHEPYLEIKNLVDYAVVIE